MPDDYVAGLAIAVRWRTLPSRCVRSGRCVGGGCWDAALSPVVKSRLESYIGTSWRQQ